MEFGFFRGLPKDLFLLDIAGQFAFLIDIILQFFVGYRDSHSYKMVYNLTPIALRYLKSHFITDLLGCMPWDIIYKAAGRKEEVRYLLWIRLTRVRKVIDFFQRMEKDIRINYLFTRIVKLIAVELYCTHTAACIFYYLATTLPEEEEGYTWIGSLKLGDYSYSQFRDIDLLKRYTTSLYFAIVTMATVGYGDIHAVNLREMIFVMIYVSFDMILGAYLIGNMTALIVKGSKTERYRDKMTDLIKYMNRNKLGKDLRNQIKGHLRLQYESSYTDATVLQDIPISIRAKISQRLYKSYVENVPLFKARGDDKVQKLEKNQSVMAEDVLQLKFQLNEFMKEMKDATAALLAAQRGPTASATSSPAAQCTGAREEQALGVPDGVQAVTRVHEEFFLPGEVIMEQGNVVDQLYFVCHGVLEEVGIGADGSEDTASLLEPNSSFGEISILCNIPQPCRVRVCELCRLLRIDKQSFSNILEIYFHDGRTVLTNLLEGKESNIRVKQVESDITFHIAKQEAELALRLNSAAYYGDLYQLKSLIRAGADLNKTDYDGRSPLHLAASRGYEDITLFLIQEGIDVNAEDKSGSTPLFEAIKNGHEIVALLLSKEGALLKIDNAGSYLCTLVSRGDSDLLRRVLSNGIDPNSRDYDQRTPLHIAASQGLFLMAKLLLEAGAGVFSKDRWGNTPVDEGRMCGNKNMIRLLEEAKAAQLSQFPDDSQELAERPCPRKCTVFPFHPWDPKEGRRHGLVMWVPHSIEELIQVASKQLEFPDGCCILSEDGGKIVEVDMIADGQKLYIINE
ncbi:hypothetical protein BUALT_Bualt04G0037900 [Buddleja alternifolia]|uniref:Potassium channel n=1 Tax=Buddleja alternifolia TaxID=168488 RepID=A0AAV6XL40_9LAMI|nr:hypothetical protein BUALT_Bualt04G0037900 [Buddleja alternifolia]